MYRDREAIERLFSQLTDDPFLIDRKPRGTVGLRPVFFYELSKLILWHASLHENIVNQRQLRKVMALGEHLRADEYVGLAVRRQCECRVDSAFALRAVAVDSRHAAIREATLQYVLESFCPLTKRFYGRPAQGAALIKCPLSSAVVAS